MIVTHSLPVRIFGEAFDVSAIPDYEIHGLINLNELDENAMRVRTVIVTIVALVAMTMVIRNVHALEAFSVHSVKAMVKFWVLLLERR